ncbi:MAG: diguanylate cyclase [Burkholderiales bacterium]
MEVFERIAEQIDAVRMPLFAVTLTALPRANTPVLLMLHWHGFLPAPEQGPVPPSHKAVPGSALQLNPPWDRLARLDEAMLDAAWQLGAWELDREERRACTTAGASDREAYECRQAFGAPPFGADGEAFMVAEAPDRAELLDLGTRVGYVQWRFRPVRGGVWRDVANDDTLGEHGGRAPPCPVSTRPPVGTRVSAVRYRLGRSERLFVAGGR